MENFDFILQDSADCLTKARDFHLLQNWRSYMPNSIKKDDIKKPGSLLRWLFVQTNDEVEQKRLFDKYLGRFKNYYSASLGKIFFDKQWAAYDIFSLWTQSVVVRGDIIEKNVVLLGAK